MHANIHPHVIKTLSHNANVPIPNPLRPTPSFPVEPTFTLTILDPKKHTAVTFPIKNHVIVGNPPGFSCGNDSENPEQQHPPKQLTDLPDDKNEGDVNTMVDYDSDPQLASGHESEDIMSDVKTLSLTKPLECMEERLWGLVRKQFMLILFVYIYFYDDIDLILECSRGGVPKLSTSFYCFS